MSLAAMVQGPQTKGILGDMPAFRRDALEFMLHCAREYGDIVPLRFGPRRAFLLNNPDDIEDVLVTQYRHFSKARPCVAARPCSGTAC